MAATDPLLFQTSLLSLVRAGAFLVARQYVNRSLFADLRSVSEDATGSEVLESPTRGVIALEEVGGEGSSGSSYFPLVGPSKGDATSGVGLSLGAASPRKGRRESLNGGNSPLPSPNKLAGSSLTAQSRLYSKLSTMLFCLSFSESCMLFTLLLFGEAVNDRSRTFNWSLSLLTLLALIIFIIPLGICLLLTHRSKSTPLLRTFILTLVPFVAYLFLFYQVGSLIASKVVVEGSHSLGLVNALLSRVCVPGVFLIASLSGGGAVNTAWEAYEWRSVTSAESVTEAQILAAERSLYRARLDLQQRNRALTLAAGSAAREAESAAGRSLLSRLTASTPAAAHLKSIEVEVAALESVEGQMIRDVAFLKKRKLMREMGRTLNGRLWLAAGWALSVYCVWRVFISCINLVFGYSQKHHRASLPVEGDAGATAPTEGTDLITSLLGRLALVLDLDIDIAMWSRLLGLVLIGSIIVANMRAVLTSVSRIFKATSAGVSTSFMLLLLAQLMAIYLLTSLISLPSSPTAATTSLLDTLPSFSVFSRLFDSVFLFAAGAVFVVRFIGRKIRVDEGVPQQYV